MKLWRISNYLDLGGEGGLHVDGRWNSIGRLIVYAAESSALAMLEVLVRYGRKVLPPPYQLLEIEAPDDLAISDFGASAPRQVERSQAWGDRWLEEGATPIAKVPSAIAPKCFNYLINPAHADAREVMLIEHGKHPWDARLFG